MTHKIKQTHETFTQTSAKIARTFLCFCEAKPTKMAIGKTRREQTLNNNFIKKERERFSFLFFTMCIHMGGCQKKERTILPGKKWRSVEVKLYASAFSSSYYNRPYQLSPNGSTPTRCHRPTLNWRNPPHSRSVTSEKSSADFANVPPGSLAAVVQMTHIGNH